ncbi:hypothetical protein N0V84_012122 [Fusarium piperis]|uniref:Autophagy-related protein 1 n=1 Tax=Fusarium piperis TaxID=1435070 RepID=A0A9W8W3S9_9HYPO|nr:hypothetical protein N0V84_012122 [Fusarium piperis]
MATLQGLPLQELPELARDSHLEATFHPNADVPNETTHLKYQARRRPQREKWARQKMLGRGGFGIVWLEKREPESPTTYNFRAVKQLDIAKIRSKRHDCVRELEALAKFSQEKYSESFVKSYGWFQSPSALFLAMEYCELGDLKDHVEDHGKLAEDQVQDIGWQILQGLRFMHHNNFAHRDLKPANILIKNKPPYGDWHVKICDLGLSKRIGIDAATTTVQGTPGFMPPESVLGIGDNPRHIDPFPVDMWCLGETIFYLLTRKRTFGGDLIRLRRYWKGDPFPKEPLLRVQASDAAISFIQELMARLPAQRLTAEMANQHELMKTEPFQEAEQDTRETSEGIQDSSAMIPEDPASGRWTTGASHQQTLGVPSGPQSSTVVEEVQIPRSPGNAELAGYGTGPPSSVQGQDMPSTLKDDDGRL